VTIYSPALDIWSPVNPKSFYNFVVRFMFLSLRGSISDSLVLIEYILILSYN